MSIYQNCWLGVFWLLVPLRRKLFWKGIWSVVSVRSFSQSIRPPFFSFPPFCENGSASGGSSRGGGTVKAPSCVKVLASLKRRWNDDGRAISPSTSRKEGRRREGVYLHIILAPILYGSRGLVVSCRRLRRWLMQLLFAPASCGPSSQRRSGEALKGFCQLCTTPPAVL